MILVEIKSENYLKVFLMIFDIMSVFDKNG